MTETEPNKKEFAGFEALDSHQDAVKDGNFRNEQSKSGGPREVAVSELRVGDLMHLDQASRTAVLSVVKDVYRQIPRYERTITEEELATYFDSVVARLDLPNATIQQAMQNSLVRDRIFEIVVELRGNKEVEPSEKAKEELSKGIAVWRENVTKYAEQNGITLTNGLGERIMNLLNKHLMEGTKIAEARKVIKKKLAFLDILARQRYIQKEQLGEQLFYRDRRDSEPKLISGPISTVVSYDRDSYLPFLESYIKQLQNSSQNQKIAEQVSKVLDWVSQGYEERTSTINEDTQDFTGGVTTAAEGRGGTALLQKNEHKTLKVLK